MSPEEIVAADARQRAREAASAPQLTVAAGTFTYPADHVPAMAVPAGGSCCTNCAFLVQMGPEGPACSQTDFIAAALPNKPAGSPKLPADPNAYCSDYWRPALVAMSRLRAAGSL